MSTGPSKSRVEDADFDVMQMARDTAYHRYIQALLVKPRTLRTGFAVCAAFHGELARIPLLVHEPMTGEIRLQWWHDTLSAMEFITGDAPNFGSPLANVVADFLATAPQAKPLFTKAVDARRAELDADSFQNEMELNAYLDGVGCSFVQVMAELLSIPDTKANRTALRSAGHAIGLMELAEKWSQLSARGRPLKIPDLGHGVEQSISATSESVLEARVAAALSHRARSALGDYRAVQTSVTDGIHFAVLPLALVEPYFKGFEVAHIRNPNARDPLTPLGRLLRLWWAAKRGKI